MKKLMVFISLIYLVIPYRSNAQPTSLTRAGNSSDTLITLNGIGVDEYSSMQTNFLKNKGQDARPKRRSIWFDAATIHLIVNLLNNEILEQKKANPSAKDTTDGIRIYFISDPSVTSGHLNNSIAIVSTKYDGLSLTAPSGALHRDYFNHLKSDPLFANPNSIRGIVKNRQFINTRGENLYNITFKQDDNETCSDPHYITRKKGNTMLNQFGHDTIKTISEWFNMPLIRSLDAESTHDGIRIYFGRHPAIYNGKQEVDALKDAFVLVTTKPGKFLTYSYHSDYFNCIGTKSYFSLNITRTELFKEYRVLSGSGGNGGGEDEGELCPANCNQ